MNGQKKESHSSVISFEKLADPIRQTLFDVFNGVNMSWDSGNNAGGDGGWGAPAVSGNDWNAGSTPWGESTADASAAVGGDSWNTGAAGTTTNDSQWASGGDDAGTGYGDSGYGASNTYDERPKNTPRPGDWDCPR